MENIALIGIDLGKNSFHILNEMVTPSFPVLC